MNKETENYGTAVLTKPLEVEDNTALLDEEELEVAKNKELKNEKEKESKDFSFWVKRGNNSYFPHHKLDEIEELHPGYYEILFSQDFKSYYVSENFPLIDELFNLPDKTFDSILEDIKTFCNSKESFEKYNFVYKRGILLYGPPGNGKSSCLSLIANMIIKDYSGIVFSINTFEKLESYYYFMKQNFRQIESKKLVLCIIEDVESITSYREGETMLLNVLDGLNQLDNIIYIATTNYPEQLKERILNRPSRFDRRYKLSYPKAAARRFYLSKKINPEDLKTIDIEQWVKETKTFSISHLGELIKSVLVLKNSFEYTIKVLKEMNENKLNSADYENDKGKSSKGIGFNSHIDDDE